MLYFGDSDIVSSCLPFTMIERKSWTKKK